MREPLRVVLAQLNFLVGDIEGNADKIIAACQQAKQQHQADLILFPELALTGYPPEDLLLRSELYTRCEQAVQKIAAEIEGIVAVLGCPQSIDEKRYNSALVLEAGQVNAVYHKQALPNYSVFDEKRYFSKGTEPLVINIQGVALGITVCEDIWTDTPVAMAVQAGAKCILNLNASPYHMGKITEREQAVRQQVLKHQLPVIYANLVGGQDELVFDGHSFVMDQTGELCFRAPAFEQGLFAVELESNETGLSIPVQTCAPYQDEQQDIYNALVLGVRDYVHKNGFDGAVIGLSGGIDSALTLAIAVDALGGEAVEAVSMPSRYTAQMSIDDAVSECDALGLGCHIISIESVFNNFVSLLDDVFTGLPVDTTEENIQARCRGVLLMAMANKKRKLVLTTGNKSEMAVGYATLYGDMAGGFAVLKDVCKTQVYALANWRNQQSLVIPQRVIDRPPSAELAPDQKDSDSLPDYPALDEILARYIEQDQSIQDIVAAGFDEQIVRKVVRLVDFNEYKRRQAAPGVRITQRAFGRDRRYPITSGFERGRSK